MDFYLLFPLHPELLHFNNAMLLLCGQRIGTVRQESDRHAFSRVAALHASSLVTFECFPIGPHYLENLLFCRC